MVGDVLGRWCFLDGIVWGGWLLAASWGVWLLVWKVELLVVGFECQGLAKAEWVGIMVMSKLYINLKSIAGWRPRTTTPQTIWTASADKLV